MPLADTNDKEIVQLARQSTPVQYSINMEDKREKGKESIKDFDDVS